MHLHELQRTCSQSKSSKKIQCRFWVLHNKAIDNNEKSNIPKDENGEYIANKENSIKVYVHMIINETTYPMESLKASGLNEFARYFGEVEFKCTDVKYHQYTGQIAEMTFAATQV